MNTGMQDAFNLAWKLARTLRGEGGEGLLDSYDTERHPIAARMLKLTTRLTKVGTIDNDAARWLRNDALHAASALSPIRHALANQIDETDISYHDSPVITHDKTPGHGRNVRTGDHLPDVPGTTLWQDVIRAMAADPTKPTTSC